MQKIELNNIIAKEIALGIKVRFVHSVNVTLAYWEVEANSSIPEHSHTQEQVCNILEGEFKLTVESKTQICKPGSVIIIPSNAKHSGKSITDCKIIDVFYPRRKDYF